MANSPATISSVGSWEELISVTFNVGTNSIHLEAEEGAIVTIPCDDLRELYHLAQISFAMAEGHDVLLKWEIPTTTEAK
jgi:hypothetical protein